MTKLEVKSKVKKLGQKHTFTHRLTINRNYQMLFYFQLYCHGIKCTKLWDIIGSEGYICVAFKKRIR